MNIPSDLWREKAIELLPELAEVAEKSRNFYAAWFDFLEAFKRAYQQFPRDQSLIRRIYRYAWWCENQPRAKTAEDDLMTCVYVCFYEYVAEPGPWRDDMPRWFQRKDVDHPNSIFRYRLDDAQWAQLLEHLRKNASLFQPRLRTGEKTPKPKKLKRKGNR